MRKGAHSRALLFFQEYKNMYLCYVDESGDAGQLFSERKDPQPVFSMLGLIVPVASLRSMTRQFLGLKREHKPNRIDAAAPRLDAILSEIKGSEVRKSFGKKNNRDRHRNEVYFLNALMSLLKKNNCRVIGRVYIKEPDREVDSQAIYSSAVQHICETFQKFLEEKDNYGSVIVDSRNHNLNTSVSHSIFTQMFKLDGDSYPSLIDMPTFGNSNNHAGLQLADLVCSSLVFPMSTHAFCIEYSDKVKSVHIQPGYGELRNKFGNKLAHMQFRYQTGETTSGGFHLKHGGIYITRETKRIRGSDIFKPAPDMASPEKMAELEKRWGVANPWEQL